MRRKKNNALAIRGTAQLLSSLWLVFKTGSVWQGIRLTLAAKQVCLWVAIKLFANKVMPAFAELI